MKYKNKKNSRIAEVTNDLAAGMGRGTMGKTFIIYNYVDEILNYPFVMEAKQFYEEHYTI